MSLRRDSLRTPGVLWHPPNRVCALNARVWLLSLAGSITFSIAGPAAVEPSEVRVGISVDGAVADAEELIKLFSGELATVLEQHSVVEFPLDSTVGSDYTLEGARAANDRLLRDPEIDIVLALGGLVSLDLAKRAQLPKPAIAPFTLGAGIQDLPQTDVGTSGIRNLSYIEPVHDFAHDVAAFREIRPFHKLAILARPSFFFAVPSAAVEGRASVDTLELEIDMVLVDQPPSDVVASIPDDVEAVYLLYVAGDDPEYFADLIDRLNGRSLPTFSLTGELGVDRGALVGLTPTAWYERVARRAALNARKMLSGQDGGTLPVQITREEQLFINMRTARRVNVYPSFTMMTEAVLFDAGDEGDEGRLSLAQAINEALGENRDVAAFEQRVAAGEQDVNVSRASLLPQVDAALVGSQIDRDRAEAGFAGPERTLAGQLGLSQILFSEAAWASWTTQRNLQDALEFQLDQLRLDVRLEAATAYFNVLQAHTDERIQRENLRLTRANLERARARLRIGTGKAAEVHRWESKIAQDQDGLVSATATTQVVEVELNRVLNRSLRERPNLFEDAFQGGVEAFIDPEVLAYFDDQRSVRSLTDFSVEKGLGQSPELASLAASLEAQDRILASNRRSFYSPDLALSGTLTTVIDSDGVGSDPPLTDGPDDTNWDVGLSLSLPLLEGGRRLATTRQARASVQQLEREYESTSQLIEERIRNSIHVASASFARIDLAARASDAARKNLDFVASSYSAGATPIIDLLDAQVSLLAAEQQAAQALFVFLSDVMEIERAVGQPTFLTASREGTELRNELRAFQERETARESR